MKLKNTLASQSLEETIRFSPMSSLTKTYWYHLMDLLYVLYVLAFSVFDEKIFGNGILIFALLNKYSMASNWDLFFCYFNKMVIQIIIEHSFCLNFSKTRGNVILCYQCILKCFFIFSSIFYFLSYSSIIVIKKAVFNLEDWVWHKQFLEYREIEYSGTKLF